MSSLSYKHNDNVYLNVVFNHSPAVYAGTNPTYITNEDPEIAEYNVTKTLPILNKASDYFASVIRFDIPLSEIPILVMPIIPNQANPDLSPLIIGIFTRGAGPSGVFYSANVEYVPDNDLPAPSQVGYPSQVITPYYYVFTYQALLNMINDTLSTLYVASGLQALWGAAGNQPPFFYLDPVSQLFKLVVYVGFTKTTAPVLDTPEIYINAALLKYLNSFEVSFNGLNLPNGNDYTFILTGNTPNMAFYLPGTNPATTPPTYFQFTEGYISIQYWTSLRKIVITTNTIPINNEYVPSNTNSSVSTSQPILTDFVPSIEFAGQGRSIAYYYPTGQYRLIDLLSDLPLQKIDLRINWEDTDGNFYPLYLSLFQQANLKMGFFRKDLYHGSPLLTMQ